jgi:DNA-binding MarR family transcriptional regulator
MKLEKEVGFVSFRNEWQKASISILHTNGLLYNGYEAFFKKYELTMQQYNLLRILQDQFPHPLSTSALREKMLDKMSDTSRLVSRLNAKGLVEVSQNPADKRLVNILISAKGQRLLEAISNDLMNLDALLQGLTEEEAMQLSSLLTKARESINTVQQRISTSQD